jgi:RNA polymerase sigma factor (sigma-70 family)
MNPDLIASLIPSTADEDAQQDAWVELLTTVNQTEAEARQMLKRLEWRTSHADRAERKRYEAIEGDPEAIQDDGVSHNVRTALYGLSQQHREILTWVYLDEVPRHEVAKRLGVSMPTFRRRLHQAKEAAKEEMKIFSS